LIPYPGPFPFGEEWEWPAKFRLGKWTEEFGGAKIFPAGFEAGKISNRLRLLTPALSSFGEERE
jgi:hypothetical protein